MKEILLDNLPQYTDWINLLLKEQGLSVKHKTEKEVMREYQDEKWGVMLEEVKKLSSPLLEEVEIKSEGINQNFPFYIQDRFYYGTGREIMDEHMEMYRETIAPYIEHASCLVELGAGYGSKILNLAQYEEFDDLPLYAAEYTQSGCNLISILANSIGKSVGVGSCDFRKLEVEGINIPENAIIFTSYSTMYVPELSKNFIAFLSDLKPLIVIHFEPCYEHYSINRVHGLLCRRYIELNDYNRNLVSIINRPTEKNEIVSKIRKNIIGNNPILPISVIEWAPTEN
jgi:hypothetical protein